MGTGQRQLQLRVTWQDIEFGPNSTANFDHITIRYSGFANLPVLNSVAYVIPIIGGDTLLDKNFINGIFIPGGNLPISNFVLPNYPASPYYINGQLTVPQGSQMTISAGVILKFGPGAALFVNGTLNAVGMTGNMIYFTALADDSIGGDTNGDSSATTPSAGYWDRIEVRNGSSAAFDYAIIRYSGWTSLGGLTQTGGSLNIDHSAITQNFIGLDSTTAGATIHHSTIAGNTVYGVQNLNAGVWLDATNNWWGDISGPEDIGTADGINNPGGKGDQVTDWVVYTPWTVPNRVFLPLARR